MIFVQNVWWVLVLLGIMILVHELGHFWAARFFDVRVEAFSFGFGPRIFGFRRGETDFRFSAILFGGYVKMAGEQPGDEAANDPRSFQAKPRWQRLIIAAAGPAMNIVLAICLLTGLFMFEFPKAANADSPAMIGFVQANSPAERAGFKPGDIIRQFDNTNDPKWIDVALAEATGAQRAINVIYERDGQRLQASVTPELHPKLGLGTVGWDQDTDVLIGAVLPGLDAERAGLKRGDVIVSVNGQPIRSIRRLHEIIGQSKGEPVKVVYQRAGGTAETTIKPALNSSDGEARYMIGVQLELPKVITKLGFPAALRESVSHSTKVASTIVQFLRGLVEMRMSPKSIDGPIGIARLSGEAAREGPGAFIELMSGVSLNLAIFNLLPIPILDGGLILMLLIEMVMRRDLSLQVKENVFKLGMIFLMAVVVFVLYNDISKLFPG